METNTMKKSIIDTESSNENSSSLTTETSSLAHNSSKQVTRPESLSSDRVINEEIQTNTEQFKPNYWVFLWRSIALTPVAFAYATLRAVADTVFMPFRTAYYNFKEKTKKHGKLNACLAAPFVIIESLVLSAVYLPAIIPVFISKIIDTMSNHFKYCANQVNGSYCGSEKDSDTLGEVGKIYGTKRFISEIKRAYGCDFVDLDKSKKPSFFKDVLHGKVFHNDNYNDNNLTNNVISYNTNRNFR